MFIYKQNIRVNVQESWKHKKNTMFLVEIKVSLDKIIIQNLQNIDMNVRDFIKMRKITNLPLGSGSSITFLPF